MPQRLSGFSSDAGRLAASFIPAAAFTLCLFVVMDRLVSVGEVHLSERTVRPLVSITPLPEEPQTLIRREPVERISEVQPPPRLDPVRRPNSGEIGLAPVELLTPTPEIDPGPVGDFAGTIVVIGRETGVPVRAPIVEYPHRALTRGIEGDCEVSFSIDAVGRPFGVSASCTDEIFARSSARAVEQTLFAAPVRNGVPVGQGNLVYPIQYRLED